MNFLFFAMLVAAPGWLVAHRLLNERSRFVVGALGFPLGLVALLVGSNLGLRVGLGLGLSLTLTWIAIAVLSALIWRKRPAPGLIADNLNPLTWLFIAAALSIVVLYCNWGQVQNLDDDFWIHTPIQTELLKGGYPPHNPFFPELFLNGHFGRDLLIVCFTYLTGYTTFWSQMAFTTAANISLFLLFFATMWRFTGSRVQAITGTTFIYFGVNMAHRVGCYDAFTNNNTAAHLWMGLMMFLSLKLWDEPRPLGAEATNRLSATARTSARIIPVIIGGIVLGSYGVVYETHFGLSIMAIVFTAATLALLRPSPEGAPLSRQTVAMTILMLALAIPQASTQGGVLTDLVRRKVLGAAQTPTEKGLLNQSQSAELHFPKKNLFCIREGWNEYQPVSCIYSHWPVSTLLPLFFRANNATPYTYSSILSRQVLKMHWLPLFLSPLTLMVLLRARHRCGLWLWYFGMSAYLVPAVVDFGPIHECEYFRWEFAASMGLAGALGLAAAHVVARWAGDPELKFDFQPPLAEEQSVGSRKMQERLEGRYSLSIKGRLVMWAPLLVLIWLNTLGWVSTTMSFMQSPWTIREAVFLRVRIQDWINLQGARYGFTDADYQACAWLAPRVGPGRQRLALNFPHQSPNTIALESFMMGMTGVYSVGHMLPPDDDPIGTPPFRMTQDAGQFWIVPTPQLLKELNPDWIFLRLAQDFNPVFQTSLESLPGVKKVYDVTGPFAEHRVIYEVHQNP